MTDMMNDFENNKRRRFRVSFLGLLTAFFVIAALAVVALLVYVHVSPDTIFADLLKEKEKEVPPTEVAKIARSTAVPTALPTAVPTNTRLRAELPPAKNAA